MHFAHSHSTLYLEEILISGMFTYFFPISSTGVDYFSQCIDSFIQNLERVELDAYVWMFVQACILIEIQ